jgi:sn-glycerol 3-phosphate transport system ATP-binding protein/multiple sugar transport system ATP-binding protein
VSAIALSGIRKTYPNGPEVLHGVGLDIAEGEFVVIVGPSGCGKSTLLRLIAGLERADAGDIVIGGRRANELPPQDRDIAMIFQNYALYPHMTVRENIAFGLELRRVPKATRNARAEDVAKLLQLTPYLDRKPAALSGGQRQRVAMGRALARDARTFLMDEPLSNLDNALRVEMRTEIKALHRQLGATMVYVTHDQTEALSLANRIAVMKDGHVLQFDTPEAIYDRPANRFVAGFLGAPAMNFLPAEALPGLGQGGLLAGIRPDAVALHAARPTGTAVQGRIVLTEMAGATVIVHCDTAHGRVTATVPRASVPTGSDAVWIGLDPSRVLWFDAASGDRVAGPARAPVPA